MRQYRKTVGDAEAPLQSTTMLNTRALIESNAMTRICATWAMRVIAVLGMMTILWVIDSRTVAQNKSSPATKGEKVAAPAPNEFECRWADGNIGIDGNADEDAWKDAQVIDNFYLPWLGKNARPARTKTKARMLWDREFLYFTAEMQDSDIYADVKEPDGQTWDNDVFELFFKPAVDKHGYYEFQVNAAGTIMDMFIPRRGTGGYQRYAKDGDFHIDAKVKLRGTLNKWSDKDEGWTIEGRIPWTDFMRTGGRPAIDERWKFALCRYDYSVDFEGPEMSTCAPLASKGHADFHLHEDYATLRFTGPPTKSRKPHGIEKRVPLTTSTVVGSPDPPLPYRVQRVYPKLQLTFPIAIVNQPGSDRMLVITQGRSYGDTIIRRFADNADVDSSEVLLDMKGTAYDIAFHPKFAENGFLYIGWNGPAGDGKGKSVKVTRYTMSPKAPYEFDPKSDKTIIEWASDGHNGGALTFGLDGMLYITSGDGTSDSDTNVMGQRLDTLLSKVLRIDVDRPDEGKTYSVPKDNPFVAVKDARPETWAYGFRNPWRIAVDRKTGHLWVGNNGQDLWEQIFFVRKGDNFGWSVYEGSHPFYLNRQLGPTPHVKPALEHHHSEARSMTGGIVYYGKKHPELRGAYIYGDYSTGRVWAAKHDGEKVVWHKEIASTRLQITGFGTDAQGEILICDHQGGEKGALYTLVPTPKDATPSTFPRKLSDSGLFQAVQGHVMQPSLIPYSVNSPLWSDGAHKERWLGLPDAEVKLDYTRGRSWSFPDKTVIVKSFALEMKEGDPSSRRWIETRFLTRQEGEWYGYSYLWNEQQTDGMLVESKGLDREFTIKTKDGERKQAWHYPSRAECMVCHSRAANWVLGLSEGQMNRDQDYGNGVRENQLHVLERLGVFNKINWAAEAKATLRERLEAKGVSEKEIDEQIAKMTETRNQRTTPQTSMLHVEPNSLRRLADPYDPKADLNARARSYLHANCSQCHVEAGGGNAQFNVEFWTKPDKTQLFDVKPVHDTFGLKDARLIAPGHPERSVLLHRFSHRGKGCMPPLATSIVDREAVKMLTEWIEKMPAK